MELGYSLSSEEHAPADLLRWAREAEDAGFRFAMISDHFHPWTDRQGQSPFVWSVIGGIAATTRGLALGTGVTCPILRTHPAIIAHAAATSEAMMPGRFRLGIGSGEALNEHVVGGVWPSPDVRLAMLEEAIDVIRLLWTPGTHSHHGRYFTVEDARLYTLPERPPPLLVAASAPKSAELAGRKGDALVGTSPKRDLVERFEQAGGTGKPRYGKVTVCWARDEASARRTAHEIWPNAAIPPTTELSRPKHFEEVATLVREEDVAREVVCGPDPEKHVAEIRKYLDAGFDHVYVHQIGPDQEGFFRFYRTEILPAVERLAA